MASKHQNRILHHLETFRSITSKEAFDIYGETRLAAVIYKLRAKGYWIATDIVEENNRYGEPCRFARYFLRGGSGAKN